MEKQKRIHGLKLGQKESPAKGYISADPCPFCNYDTVSAVRRGKRSGWQMFCGACKAEGPFKPTYELACDAWNSRHNTLLDHP